MEVILATLLGTALSGIGGNRADALFMMGFKAIQGRLTQSPDPLQFNPALTQAIYRSYLKACESIARDCKQTLLGGTPQQYRGTEIIPVEHQAEVDWLNQKLEILSDALRMEQLPVDNVWLASGAVEWSGIPETQAEWVAAIQERLVAQGLIEDMIPLYVERLRASSDGLWDRMGAFFAAELQAKPELQSFFQTQVLTQLQQQAGMQQFTLENLLEGFRTWAGAVSPLLAEIITTGNHLKTGQNRLEEGQQDIQQGIERIEAKLEHLQPLSPDTGSPREHFSTTSRVDLPPNPFIPTAGRVNDRNHLFAPAGILDEIFEILNSGPGVALIGGATMGKSSLLKLLQYRAAEQLRVPRQPLYLDLKKIQSEDIFWEAFCNGAGIPFTLKSYELERYLESKQLLLLLDEVEKMTWDGFTQELRSQLRGFAEEGVLKISLILQLYLSRSNSYPLLVMEILRQCLMSASPS